MHVAARIITQENGSVNLSPEKINLFWSRVFKTDKCWLWTSSQRRGYGVIKVNNIRYSAHRISYVIHKGEIPEGMFICHSCDVKNCVNPEHLKIGSHKQNMREMKERGRAARGLKNGVFNNSENIKLSPEKILEIRKKIIDGQSNSQIGKQYGVTGCMISRINTKKAWAHII